MFFAANAVGITFYLIAFAEEMVELVGHNEGAWFVKLYASAALLVLLAFALIGAGFFSKINFLIFIVLAVSIVISILSFYVNSDYGFAAENLSKNLWFVDEGAPGKEGFFTVFIVCFPAMTGVMAGANMSGDLKNPGKSIGRGTLFAVITALIVYSVLVFTIAATVSDRTTLLNLKIIIMQKVWSDDRVLPRCI